MLVFMVFNAIDIQKCALLNRLLSVTVTYPLLIGFVHSLRCFSMVFVQISTTGKNILLNFYLVQKCFAKFLSGPHPLALSVDTVKPHL